MLLAFAYDIQKKKKKTPIFDYLRHFLFSFSIRDSLLCLRRIHRCDGTAPAANR